MLSVIVPIYNVEGFLRAALDSLAVQTFDDVEVIMVDDGSTDGSALIAAEFAARDSRFHLIAQVNGGLSNARNTGIRHAGGDYLTFVDSDDMSPHYAFKTALRVLEHTGSDFLTGKVSRFDERGIFDVPMQRKSHSKNILRTTVTETPDLMRDFLPHNKIYRRSFWDSAELEFPDGLTFEDGPVSVRAHALAKSVDVVTAPIYYWRQREGASPSISRQNARPHFYVDRIQTSIISVGTLSSMRPDLLHAFYAVDIRHKFGIMFASLIKAPSEVQQQFMAAAIPYLERAPHEVIDELPAAMHERILLTRRGDLAGLLAALTSKPAKSALPAGDAPRPRRGLSHSPVLRAAASYLGQGARDGVTGVVQGIHLQDGVLRITGFAHLPGLPAEGPLSAGNRKIWARHAKSRTRVRLPLRSTFSPEATVAQSEQSAWSAKHSGYDASVDITNFRDASGEWRYGTWRLEMDAVTPRGKRKGGLPAGWPATPRDLRPIDLDADTRMVPTIKDDGTLTLRLVRTEATLTDYRVDGSHLVLTGAVRGAVADGTRLQLCRVPQVAELFLPVEWGQRRDGFTGFVARLPMADVLAEVGPVRAAPVAGVQNRLSFQLAEPGEEGRILRASVSLPPVSVAFDGHRLEVCVDSAGRVTLILRPQLPSVEHITWRADGTLELSGTGADLVHSPRLVLRHSKRKEERTFPIEVSGDGSWHVRLHPERGPEVALRGGQWQLVLRSREHRGEVLDVDFPYLPDALPATGVNEFSERYSIRAAGLDRLAMHVGSRLDHGERGRFNRRILREEVYPAVRKSRPLRDVVLYESFAGKQYSDSPRALYELLSSRDDGLEHVWVTKDAQAPTPEGVRTIEAGGRDWYEALATSRYVVASTHLPHWFRRREGQTVAQTWPGVGLRRFALDIESIHGENPAYLEKLALETPNWSFLISPSSFCTPILRRAFGYEGEICELGTPRNDLLVAGDRAAITAKVRGNLGIPADKKILLYAPTCRDTEYHAPGQYKFDLKLDLAAFTPALRAEYVLLVRRHPDAVDDLLGLDNDFVIDVANYPDVRQLLCATDVLITDYSTIALDFANTGRPILFYAYDLEHYRDQVRGFSFDLEHEGPGPILRTTEEVVAALSDVGATAAHYRERYDAIRATFCHAEDGRATERFAARLLADRGTWSADGKASGI